MKPWYEELFANYAEHYDQESFTQGTIAEVDFIEREFGPDKSIQILDIGCGTGRHAIELNRRGYRVTGIDLSPAQLNRARQQAAKAGLAIPFIEADARNLPFREEFDAAIMICEGAFPLMETDEMNFQILESAGRTLKPGAPFIFTTLSALFPLFHDVKEFMDQSGSLVTSKEERFDLLTFRSLSRFTFTDDTGRKNELTSNERYYSPSEIIWLLKTIGFDQIGIFGCETGKFSREIPLTPDHFEMLVCCKKKKGG